MTTQTRSVNELIRAVEESYEAKLPLFLRGPPGVGKSDAVRQAGQKIADQRDLEYVEPKDGHIFSNQFAVWDIRGSTLDPVDLRGIPHIDEEKGVTEWMTPNFFPLDPDAKGIIFLDELNLAPKSVQDAAYQLILDRQLGDYVLPDDVLVLAAGNRMEDRAGIQEMGAPLKNRFTHIEITDPNVEEWVEWASRNGVDPRITTFIDNYSQLLYQFDTETSENAFPTPRSWIFVSDLIEDETSINRIRKKAERSVGRAAAQQFESFIEVGQKIDVEEHIGNPSKVNDLRVDETYALAGELTIYLRDFTDREKVTDIDTAKKIWEVMEIAQMAEPEIGALITRYVKQTESTRKILNRIISNSDKDLLNETDVGTTDKKWSDKVFQQGFGEFLGVR